MNIISLDKYFVEKDNSDVEKGTNLEKKSKAEYASTAFEPIVGDPIDADNQPLVKTFNGDDITEHVDSDGNEPVEAVDNPLSKEQPNKKKFKNLDEIVDKGAYLFLLDQLKRYYMYTKPKRPLK